MPFGLKNAPSVLPIHMSLCIIMTTSQTKAVPLSRLQTVLQTLFDASFLFNVAKCSFLKSSDDYLGFQVKDGEIRPNPRKIQALRNIPPPQSVTQVRQFIGLASYNRQFVPKYFEKMKPLYNLTCKNKILQWKPEHEQIRQTVLTALTDEPVLVIFDP